MTIDPLLLMDHRRDHTIDIPRNDVSSSLSTSSSDEQQNNGSNADGSSHRHSRALSTEVALPSVVPESSSGNSSASSDARRDQLDHHRPQQNPLNSVVWISLDLTVTVSQIVAGVSVLSLSRHEHPHAPLFEWLLAYTIGCVATLPHLYWRYLHRNRRTTEPPATTGQLDSASDEERNTPAGSNDAANSSSFRASSEFMNSSAHSNGVLGSSSPIASPRVYALVGCFKLVLDCFFAVWFVVGNVWMFGSRPSSAHDAPNLYRTCLVFLAFGFVGYLTPFVLCTMVCCCLPCIITALGAHEDAMDANRGAAKEAINALVAYKYQSRKVREDAAGVQDGGGGVLAAGTDKERTISAEDAVCCICLSRFSNNEDLRELPCAHVFHMECVDKWLQINALCPLCKGEIAGSSAGAAKTESQNNPDAAESRVPRHDGDVESQQR